MNAYQLKCIACGAVLLANLARVLLPGELAQSLATLPLYFAFPLLAALTAESCRRTGHWGRYLHRMALAFLSGALPYYFLYGRSGEHWTSLLLPLLLASCALWAYDKLREDYPLPTALLPLLGACVCAGLLRCEFGFPGVLLVGWLYLFGEDDRERRKSILTWAVVCCLLAQPLLRLLPLLPAGLRTPNAAETVLRVLRREGWLYLARLGCALLSLPFLHRYNGTRGKEVRWPFYLAYPLHLFLLLLLHLLPA